MKSKYCLRHYLKQRKDIVWTVNGVVPIGDKKFIMESKKGLPIDAYYIKELPTGVTNNWVDVIQLKLYNREEIKYINVGF